VHRRLRELLESGHKSVAMEVSSHALDQQRVAGVHFDIAVFTNLTRDHLDYHGTEAAYMAAKARLFQWPQLRDAVINVDDPAGRQLVATLPANVDLIKTSAHGPIAEAQSRALWASSIRPLSQGLEIEIGGSWGEGLLRSSLIGDFNAENLLSVLAVLLAWGLTLPRAMQLLELCSAPPGRMERIGSEQGPIAVVDYAHTPDALDKALTAAREHCAGKLICVFGCGGDRDRGKRALMGAVAERRADVVYVTDDNPRNESSAQIIDEILTGFSRPESARVQPDRATAIRTAIAAARAGDIVLIAGKGHEDYQIIGAEVRPFSDRDVASSALKAVL
jgi:UDP-N-acetylmuramoyl-L-alanyl-D-glutamate--2,6-diaminopimelate ligase